MNEIMNKTYELIDILDDSDIIKELVYYKEVVSKNEDVVDLVKRYNNIKDNDELLKIKRKLYDNKDYIKYIDNYNKLWDIIRKINFRYKKLLGTRSCAK